jgi:hypothetical protein
MQLKAVVAHGQVIAWASEAGCTWLFLYDQDQPGRYVLVRQNDEEEVSVVHVVYDGARLTPDQLDARLEDAGVSRAVRNQFQVEWATLPFRFPERAQETWLPA